MTQSDFEYLGTTNLETMLEALNYNQALCELVIDQAPVDGKLVLDFGAGIGTFSERLQQKGYEVLCVEPDPSQRRVLQQKGFEAFADISDIPGESVDYLYSLNVLEHIEDDQSAARQLLRILKPGGNLMVYVPAFQALFTRMDERVGHHRRYRRKELCDLLNGVGFHVTRSDYYDFLGFFATLAMKHVGDRGDGTVSPYAVRIYDRWIFPISRRLSPVFGKWIGKNLVVYAERPL